MRSYADMWHTTGVCKAARWVVGRGPTLKGSAEISKMFRRHVIILVFRVLLLAASVYMYLSSNEKQGFNAMLRRGFSGVLLYAIWAVLVIGMLFRLIPNKRVAIGARKHYARSYQAAPATAAAPAVPATPATHAANKESGDAAAKRNRLHKGALVSALAWIAFNAAVFAALYISDMLTPAAAVVLMLVYAVCDIVCILFFCPFQAFFMRNRCCAQCRIHNWDYLMICTPLVLFPSIYSYSLLLTSAAVVIRWEIALRKNPHYFMAETNENLRCEQCDDKLCLVNKPLEQ